MAKLNYGSMKKGEEPAAKGAADESAGETKATETKAEDAGKESEGAKIADEAGAPVADLRSKHAAARAELRKMHQAERRDLNNQHKTSRSDMYARQEKAMDAMMDAHDLELQGGAPSPETQTADTAGADQAQAAAE